MAHEDAEKTFKSAMSAATSDGAQAVFLSYVKDQAALLTAASTAVAALPVPSFTGGQTYATSAIASLAESAGFLKKAETATAAGDIAGAQTAVADLKTGPAHTAALAMSVSESTKTAIRTVADCKTLGL